jgi:membrane protease YdiL (CAAX protease family)
MEGYAAMPILPNDSVMAQPGGEARAVLSQMWAIAWRITVFFVLWGLLLAPAVLPQAWLHDSAHHSPAWIRLYFDGTALLASLGACAIMVRWVDRGMPLGFDRTRAGTDSLSGLAGGAAWLGVSLGLIALLGGVAMAPRGIFTGSALVLAAASGWLNAAVQEVVARSYIFQLVRQRSGPGWAVVVSSGCFVAMHAGAFHGAVLPMVNVLAASVLFGLVLLRTGSLWAVIALHFAWNFIVGPVLGLAVSGHDLADGRGLLRLHGPEWLTGGTFGLEGSAVVTLVTIASCLVVGRAGRSRA